MIVKSQSECRTNSSVKLDPKLSERIAVLRLPLIVGVVFIHGYDTVISRTYQLHYSGWVRFVCDYISEGLATVSVPLLFLISGYLYFSGLTPSRVGFTSQISKRIRNLAIPYLGWNVLCFGVMSLAQSIPALSPYWGGRSIPIAAYTPFDYLNAIIGIDTHPIAYQFWYVRDLMVLIVISPVLYFLLKYCAAPFLAGVIFWWWGSGLWMSPVFSRESLLFFSIGGFFAIRQINPISLDKFAGATLVYLPLSIWDALAHQGPSSPIHKIAELFGIAFVFCATKYVHRYPACRRTLLTLSSASFFVFAAHEPLLTILRKVSFHFCSPANSSAILFFYFANSTAVIVLCTMTYYLCRRAAPQLTSLMTGGR